MKNSFMLVALSLSLFIDCANSAQKSSGEYLTEDISISFRQSAQDSEALNQAFKMIKHWLNDSQYADEKVLRIDFWNEEALQKFYNFLQTKGMDGLDKLTQNSSNGVIGSIYITRYINSNKSERKLRKPNIQKNSDNSGESDRLTKYLEEDINGIVNNNDNDQGYALAVDMIKKWYTDDQYKGTKKLAVKFNKIEAFDKFSKYLKDIDARGEKGLTWDVLNGHEGNGYNKNDFDEYILKFLSFWRHNN